MWSFLNGGRTTLPSGIVAIFNSLRTAPFAARSCGLVRFYSAHVTALPRTSPRHVRIVKSTNFTETTGPRAEFGLFFIRAMLC